MATTTSTARACFDSCEATRSPKPAHSKTSCEEQLRLASYASYSSLKKRGSPCTTAMLLNHQNGRHFIANTTTCLPNMHPHRPPLQTARTCTHKPNEPHLPTVLAGTDSDPSNSNDFHPWHGTQEPRCSTSPSTSRNSQPSINKSTYVVYRKKEAMDQQYNNDF